MGQLPTPRKRIQLMHSYHILTNDPVYSALASGLGTLAYALAFAAMRAEMVEVNDTSPDSSRPTIPCPAQAA